jgi:protein arginine kinase activator
MKPCDLCGKPGADMKVSQLDKDGKVTELVVCSECARARGFSEVEKIKMDVAEILADLKSRVAEDDANIKCGRCGLTYAEFRRLGRVGCAECYTAFHEQMVPLVRRIHGAVQHVGRATHTGRKEAQVKMNAQKLREALSKAVEQEDYEKAAQLRDQLRTSDDETGG